MWPIRVLTSCVKTTTSFIPVYENHIWLELGSIYFQPPDIMATGFTPSMFTMFSSHAALVLLEFLGVALDFMVKSQWPEE